MTNTLTVVVPIYDPTFDQQQRIIRMVDSITNQSLMPEEVVLSSSHEIPYLREVEKVLQGKTLLKFFMNSSTSAPENLNLSIQGSTSSLVKILFQDDFLLGANHLELLKHKFVNSQSQWGVTSSTDFHENLGFFKKPRIPKFAESLSRGINKIGAPSVAIFRKESFVPFDERLKYVFDCEWYLSMKHRFGKPLVIPDASVGIGMHSDQATHWAKSLLEAETVLVKRKHHMEFRGFLKSRVCACQVYT